MMQMHGQEINSMNPVQKSKKWREVPLKVNIRGSSNALTVLTMEDIQ